MTTPVRLVLDALAHAEQDELVWGYRLCEQTGLGSGTVYPILERLTAAGYVTSSTETPRPADRPSRRFYELTSTGRQVAARVRPVKTPVARTAHVADRLRTT
jgi:PadR family transcriptional regulator, regulatory protein PadR